eukprot:TRINITY_DN1465_c0_g1_i5.p2 TRINITY_DN1465_c0_g1~~TRINITY_DN1465_c0_g1_i5.p2  ORF type:complete len:105 (+),score=16.31 TRINITY_DN1465_c0_g1_i5:119-433(+)
MLIDLQVPSLFPTLGKLSPDEQKLVVTAANHYCKALRLTPTYVYEIGRDRDSQFLCENGEYVYAKAYLFTPFFFLFSYAFNFFFHMIGNDADEHLLYYITHHIN